MRYSSRQLEKLQQKQEQFYLVPWVPEVFFFFPFFKKKTSETLPNGDPHDLFHRTCSYFENGPLAIGLKNLKIQPKSQHHI